MTVFSPLFLRGAMRCALVLLFAMTGWLAAAPTDPPKTIQGVIFDVETNEPVEGARIDISTTNQTVYSGPLGRFSLNSPTTGQLNLTISSLGYARQELSLDIDPEQTSFLRLELRPAPIQLADVVISDGRGGIQPLRVISEVDLNLRPVQSSQDVLRNVPGLFIAQHAGGGKAEQIFLRGFDIDHGTDIALSVDGMPVNMVSHAHGQGYSDLHFVIPETIERIDFGKGMYEAGIGNFNTAGYASFRTKNSLDQSLVKVEAGQFNTWRGLAMIDLLPGQQDHHAWVATEYRFSDGYFDASQNFNRLNGMAKYSGLIGDNLQLSVSASAFTSSWDASGQIPVRAVESGEIDWFGAIDSTEGGETSRRNLNLELTSYLDNGSTFRNQLYVSQYDFSLFSNFTFFLEDSVNGDQIHQVESRTIYGYNGSWEQQTQLGDAQLRTTIGASFRMDDVRDNELSHTVNRTEVLETFSLGDIMETNASVYANEQLSIGRFTAGLGLRYDVFRFAYQDQLTEAYDPQSVTKGILSPKLSFSFQANENVQLYLKAGTGFHSNDTRVILQQTGRDILPRATGADLGVVMKPVRGMLVQAALWSLRLEQEFVYVGDAGIVEPSGRTQRSGVDVSLRYQILPWLFADADVNYTLAEAVDEPEGQNYIPLAPWFTSTGGLQARWDQFSASLRYRHLADRAANEDNSLTADGYTLLDAVLSYTAGPVTIQLAGENLLDVLWKEAQFDTESRLRGEDGSVSEIHFTPGTPRFVRLGLSVAF